jgi:hypothetical protein
MHLLFAWPGLAATPKEVDAAIQLGAGYLKDLYKNAEPRQLRSGPNGIGPAALAGLALLECGTPHSDPSLRSITAAVRDASFTVTQTYQVSLCLLYLDRLGDASDGPLIQMLGVRLLAGQSGSGGWSYECTDAVSIADERDLRSALLSVELTAVAGKPSGKPAADAANKPGAAEKLHPEIARYQQRIAAPRGRARIDDNSNTQFGVLGVWAARKHAVPTEAALDLIEKRFLNTQTSSGGWPYSGSKPGSPSMTCVGLLGLATAIARREERRRPSGPAQAKGEAAPAAKAPADDRDRAVQKALAALGPVLAARGKGPRFVITGAATPGDRDLYFLWSVERVATLFGLDRIAGVDWYDVGAEELVAGQNLTGSWGRGGKGAEIDTAFAILFLVRSNLLQDLSYRLQKGGFTVELRSSPPRPGAAAGPTPPPAPSAKPGLPGEEPAPRRPNVTVIRPNSASSAEDPKKLADDLVSAQGLEWGAAVSRAKDAKGTAYTQALVLAIGRLEGDRAKQAREALAERLTRMTAETLRTMAKGDEAELRRASILAMAMKDDKTFIPDLIAALEDEDLVARAAHAGLKSLTGKDLGPSANSTGAERKAAVAAWKDWWALQKR